MMTTWTFPRTPTTKRLYLIFLQKSQRQLRLTSADICRFCGLILAIFPDKINNFIIISTISAKMTPKGVATTGSEDISAVLRRYFFGQNSTSKINLRLIILLNVPPILIPILLILAAISTLIPISSI